MYVLSSRTDPTLASGSKIHLNTKLAFVSQHQCYGEESEFTPWFALHRRVEFL